jgi:hypothetical protein
MRTGGIGSGAGCSGAQNASTMTGVGDEEVRQLLDELYAVRRLPKVCAV